MHALVKFEISNQKLVLLLLLLLLLRMYEATIREWMNRRRMYRLASIYTFLILSFDDIPYRVFGTLDCTFRHWLLRVCVCVSFAYHLRHLVGPVRWDKIEEANQHKSGSTSSRHYSSYQHSRHYSSYQHCYLYPGVGSSHHPAYYQYFYRRSHYFSHLPAYQETDSRCHFPCQNRFSVFVPSSFQLLPQNPFFVTPWASA